MTDLPVPSNHRDWAADSRERDEVNRSRPAVLPHHKLWAWLFLVVGFLSGAGLGVTVTAPADKVLIDAS